MPVSFRTIVQPNILLQACTKLGLTRDGRIPDLGPDKSTKRKASEYLAEGFQICSQGYSQLVTQSLPSVKLLLVDSSDHSPAPADRWVAEEGVKGAFVTAKELFPYKSQEATVYEYTCSISFVLAASTLHCARGE